MPNHVRFLGLQVSTIIHLQIWRTQTALEAMTLERQMFQKQIRPILLNQRYPMHGKTSMQETLEWFHELYLYDTTSMCVECI